MPNYYFTSSGDRVSKSVVDRRTSEAKAKKIEEFLEEHNYLYCEDCKQNNCAPIDCSHDISVKVAQETRRTELAWDVSNITLRGRACHEKHDNSGLIPGGK